MKQHETIAIPLWKNQVAPRFGCADTFLVVAVGRNFVGVSEEVEVNEQSNWNERLSTLLKHKVDVIVCGGFNNQYLPLAERLGLRVKTGVGGNADKVVKQYAEGTLCFGTNRCAQRRKKQIQGRCNKPPRIPE